MRRRKLIALAGLAVLVSVGAFVPWPQEDRITREGYDKVRHGMSPAEVEAVLGPPGDYRSGPTTTRWDENLQAGWGWSIAEKPRNKLSEVTCEWHSDTFEIFVTCSASEGVIGASLNPQIRQEQGPLDNLLWRAKRLWRKWFPE
jgi:hypothetical protein